MRRKLKKIKGYLYAKVQKARYEKHFKGEVDLKYLKMGPDQGDTLVVVFGSFTRKGVAARYNYVKTLRDIEVPKVFILDDFGLDGRGSYYLGQDGGEEVYRTTRDLIASLKVSTGAKTTIYCGSSKGGWAAMRFGLGDLDGIVVAGSPQYLLGDYAVREYDLEDGNKMLLPYLSAGLKDDVRIQWLNGILRGVIRDSNSLKPVYLCYSKAEHTYDEHICYLLDDLRSADRDVHVREEKFGNHNDIALYFPDFLYGIVEELALGK